MEGGGSRNLARGKNGDVRTLPTAKWPPLCLKVLDDCPCQGLAVMTSAGLPSRSQCVWCPLELCSLQPARPYSTDLSLTGFLPLKAPCP